MTNEQYEKTRTCANCEWSEFVDTEDGNVLTCQFNERFAIIKPEFCCSAFVRLALFEVPFDREELS